MTTDERAALVRALVAELVTTETVHLDYELIERYADRKSDPIDRRVVESHISECTMCGREVRDFETFASRARRNRRWVELAIAAVTIALLFALAPLLRSSPTVVSLQDGDHEVHLTQNGRLFGVPNITVEEEREIVSVLRGGPIIMPPESLRLASATRSRDPLLSPSSCFILDDRPVFQWTAIPDARYRVDVLSEDLRPVFSGVTNTNQWAVPTALGRGVTYVWRVTSLTSHSEQPLTEARFAIATERAAEAIHRLEHVQPRSHLALGIEYAEAGITAEAERELSLLASENPGSADIQRLLQQVRVPSE